MFFITTKFHDNLLSGFRGVALTKKTGLTDGSKTLYPPQLVAWGIITSEPNSVMNIQTLICAS